MAKTEVIKSGDGDDEHPIMRQSVRATVGRSLDRALNNISFGIEEWTQEMRSTAQAATVSGDFDASFKFYEALGKSMGAIQDPKAQHLHVHANSTADVQQMSTEEINERRAVLMRQQKADDDKKLLDAQLADLM